jgi:DNA-binding transcriptional regulator YhcF (GntR family)
MPITKESDIEEKVILMLIEIDFNSDEAFYVQLQNQIIMGIAMNLIREGDSLPSVRQLANTVGINMHTVNKAYAVLKQEGFIQLDRRRGAVIAIDMDQARALIEMKEQLRVLLARGRCKNISKEEVHALVDEIYEEYGRL